MGNDVVKTQLMHAQEALKSIREKLGDYLNETTLSNMTESGESSRDYYETILTALRRIFVHCDEGLDHCRVILNGKSFRKAAAERVLYWIYHQCVEEFFNPKNDSWYEDSRAAYTGKNAIKFSEPVPDALIELVRSLEGQFQSMREDLEYYETDYRTKMTQKGNAFF